ncbi:hypothetical protein HSBGL_2762 [Halapricum desulfuricans]|uniref:Uncharacterized protein n=1 Tax=Halapricum desulfuricans TaxID=2841257 RepID=A0A897NQR2_9EURY|nr:hypothetical protein [Halapricum desulfuricans]QSG13159.1 hypothetical protein HSBGL_2762 [Halapricum desulfuricans]
MALPNYDALIEWLQTGFDGDLRWVASFNHRTFSYKVKYIREDLKTDLSGMELETIIHRSMAVLSRDHVEDVYFHLGDAEALLVKHEKAMAVHLYLTEETGVVIKLADGAEITVPAFFEDCRDHLDV